MTELIAKRNDFTEWDNNPRIHLDHIDKNGTHHYVDTRCPKCDGTGVIPYYGHVDGGVCFLCGGSGHHDHKLIVRTEGYARKLEEKRLNNNRKKAQEMNKTFLEKEGFTPEGKTYIVLGNTWPIKEQLKKAGAFFTPQLGWHFNFKPEKYPVHELDIKSPIGSYYGGEIYLLGTNGYGAYAYHTAFSDVVEKYVKSIREQYENSLPTETEWFGEAGKRVTLNELNCTLLTSWDTMYGTTMLYKFVNPEGFIFTWKTGTYIEEEYLGGNRTLTLTGTIKEHSRFKGEKQTELTRCKISYEK